MQVVLDVQQIPHETDVLLSATKIFLCDGHRSIWSYAKTLRYMMMQENSIKQLS